jgi:hypothetical protein
MASTIFRYQLPSPKQRLWKPCIVIVNELRAILAKPDSIIRMTALLGGERSIVARATNSGASDMRSDT